MMILIGMGGGIDKDPLQVQGSEVTDYIEQYLQEELKGVSVVFFAINKCNISKIISGENGVFPNELRSKIGTYLADIAKLHHTFTQFFDPETLCFYCFSS